VLEPQFNSIGDFGDQLGGLARVMLSVDGKTIYGLLDQTGELVLEPQFNSIGDFSDNGLSKVSLSVEGKNKYGLLNQEFKVLLDPQFDRIDIEAFSDKLNGLARVKLYVDGKTKYGLLNQELKVVLEPQFDQIGNIGENGLVSVKLGGKWILVEKTGRILMENQMVVDGLIQDYNLLLQEDTAASITLSVPTVLNTPITYQIIKSPHRANCLRLMVIRSFTDQQPTTLGRTPLLSRPLTAPPLLIQWSISSRWKRSMIGLRLWNNKPNWIQTLPLKSICRVLMPKPWT